MMTDRDVERVTGLLNQVPRPAESAQIEGASPAQIHALEQRLGHAIPVTLRRWLEVCNGLVAGPGGLYGATDGTHLDIAHVQGLWPSWRVSGWLPVAGDGNGNAYLMGASPLHGALDAVYFVDCSDDPDAIAYVVASSLPKFLTFLLERELGERRWPFDAEYVQVTDPRISEIDEDLLPWIG
jgi:cell wall assembly regulator SMI1